MICRKKLLGYFFFQQSTTYNVYKKTRKKYLRSSHVDSKQEIASFHVETATGNRQPSNAKNGG